MKYHVALDFWAGGSQVVSFRTRAEADSYARRMKASGDYRRVHDVYGENPMRRRHYRRNPEGEGRGSHMGTYLLVGGALYLLTRPGGLGTLFGSTPTAQANPYGATVGGVYYPPGTPIPTYGSTLGTAAGTAGITAGIASLGSLLTNMLNNLFSGPSASTVSSGSGTTSAAITNSINPNPSPDLSIGAADVGGAPVAQTTETLATDLELAYAEALANQAAVDAATVGQYVADGAPYQGA